MKHLLTSFLVLMLGLQISAQDCGDNPIFFSGWDCDCANEEAFFLMNNLNDELGGEPGLVFTINGVVLTDSLTWVPVAYDPNPMIQIVASNDCTWFDQFSLVHTETTFELQCLNASHSNCENDGDCSNGIETFNPLTCECNQIATIEGCVVPSACNYNPQANCPTECVFDSVNAGQSCDDADPNTVGDFVNCEGICSGIPCTEVENNCVNDGLDFNGIEIFDAANCICTASAPVEGCTDAAACNYNPAANIDFGCLFIGQNCLTSFPQNPGTINEDCNCEEDTNISICDDDFFISENFSCDGGSFTYTINVIGPIDPTEAYLMTGTGIGSPISVVSGQTLSFTFSDGTAIDWFFTDPSGCIAGTFSSGGPIACSIIPIGENCDDGNPNTFDDVYLEYGCHGTPCALNAFACPDDGDCSNGFETFDLENCECISVGDCGDNLCSASLEVELLEGAETPTAVLAISNTENISYTILLNDVVYTTMVGQPVGLYFVIPLPCPNPYESTIQVIAPNTSCETLTAVIACGGLPITLIDFDGEVQEKGNNIYWSTASENNSDFFSVERSPNGEDKWNTLGMVPASINSTSTKHYQFMDTNPAFKTSYYRLKEHDQDGNVKVVSNVLALARPNIELEISIYPSPTTDVLNISANSLTVKEASIEVRTIDGKVLIQEYASDLSNVQLDTNALQAGYYLVVINYQEGVETFKILKR